MKAIYSIRDLAIAKDVVATFGRIDQFGVSLISDSDMAWAEEVIAFFKSLYYRARSFVGDWCARIKLAWLYAKGLISDVVSEVAKKLQRKVAKFGGRVLPDGSILLGTDVGKYQPLTMKTHVKRYFSSK